MKTRKLREIVAESRVRLLEADEAPAAPAPAPKPEVLQNDSLDLQLDHLIQKADGSQDEMGNPVQTQQNELNVVNFSSEIARVVEKCESVLDLEGTIVRRALNYVSKNYNADVKRQVAEVLSANFGIEADPSPADDLDDPSAPKPNAAGAGVEV